MNTGYEMFLLVCEEMSFSAAARRAFVTQQCLSDHIRRLEERLGVRLFERRPHLRLTPAGETLRAGLRRMQALEEDLSARLGQYQAGLRGEVRLGINSGRASVLLPRVFPAFHALFPHVKLFVINRETREMEKMLAAGELDLFLGLNTRLEEAFHVRPLGQEKLYLTLPAALLEQRFGEGWAGRLDALNQGADLREFQDIPFVGAGQPQHHHRPDPPALPAAGGDHLQHAEHQRFFQPAGAVRPFPGGGHRPPDDPAPGVGPQPKLRAGMPAVYLPHPGSGGRFAGGPDPAGRVGLPCLPHGSGRDAGPRDGQPGRAGAGPASALTPRGVFAFGDRE